tara:strand:- start:6 stop:266 length:261 start_codon:yes stop_codon:yes gene_type:complete
MKYTDLAIPEKARSDYLFTEAMNRTVGHVPEEIGITITCKRDISAKRIKFALFNREVSHDLHHQCRRIFWLTEYTGDLARPELLTH